MKLLFINEDIFEPQKSPIERGESSYISYRYRCCYLNLLNFKFVDIKCHFHYFWNGKNQTFLACSSNNFILYLHTGLLCYLFLFVLLPWQDNT